MKAFTKTLIAGAMILLMAPAAMAYDGCRWGYRPSGYVYNDMARDRHRIWREENDIARDRYRLNQELAYGNWRAARAQQADINRDLYRLHENRRDLAHDYYRYGY